MTYFKRCVRTGAVALWTTGLGVPAMAQSQAGAGGGMLGRILDRHFEFNWLILLLALLALIVAVVSYHVWYRAALAHDLRLQRLPDTTRLASLGLAIAVFAATFALVDRDHHVGIMWPLVLIVLGALVVMFGRAFALAIGILLALILLVFSRIYGWV